MIRHAAAVTEAKCILAPDVLSLGECTGGVKAAAGQNDLAVKAGLRILKRVDLNHPSHFSSIFSGEASSVDAHRLHVVSFNLRSEARRAIIGERDAVHDKLSLVLGTPRMQDGVAFV